MLSKDIRRQRDGLSRKEQVKRCFVDRAAVRSIVVNEIKKRRVVLHRISSRFFLLRLSRSRCGEREEEEALAHFMRVALCKLGIVAEGGKKRKTLVDWPTEPSVQTPRHIHSIILKLASTLATVAQRSHMSLGLAPAHVWCTIAVHSSPCRICHTPSLRHGHTCMKSYRVTCWCRRSPRG